MIITTQAILVGKTEASYTFEGRSGISRKARVLIENEIFELRFSENDINLFNELPPQGSKFEGQFEFNSPKERLVFSLRSINKKQ
jgi:hypothetical protein